LDLELWRAKQGSQRAEVGLYGKWWYALVIDPCARRHVGGDWSRRERKRPARWGRVWKTTRREVGEWITRVLHWRQDQGQVCFEVMQERPRRRQLQALPDGVSQLIAVCRRAGLCAV
jgi:hypothetical protein